jgi:heptosyltransferase III
LRKILLIQLRQLGDILLTTPCIREIKREEPNAHIAFLSHPMGKKILNQNPYIDETYYIGAESLVQQWEIWRMIRAKKYDVVVDFMNNPRSAGLTWFSDAHMRVAFPSKRFFCYNHRVPHSQEPQYIVKEKFRLLEACGFEPRDVALTLPWFETDTRPLMQLLGSGSRFRDAALRIVLSPTHRRENRRWPLASYAQLADWLIEKWKAEIIWTWGPGEESVVREVASQCRQPTVVSPPTTFRELAAIMANCDLFIGNSNGPSHVAVAVKIPSLQLHGPTIPRSWSPLTGGHEAISSSNKPIAALKVDEVTECLERTMRPVVTAHRSLRKDQVRVSWTQKL